MRVDRDAVAADADPRLVDVAVRLAVRGRDHFGDVDAVQVGRPGELVGERDVDIAVGRVGELGEFGRLRRGHRDHFRVEHARVEARGPLRRRRREAADELGVGREVGDAPRPCRAAPARRRGRSPAPQRGPWRPPGPARTGFRVVPIGRVVSKMTVLPAWIPGAIAATAGSMYRKSGRRFASSITGTIRTTTSASRAAAAASSVARRRPSAWTRATSSAEAGLLGDVRATGVDRFDDRGIDVDRDRMSSRGSRTGRRAGGPSCRRR